MTVARGAGARRRHRGRGVRVGVVGAADAARLQGGVVEVAAIVQIASIRLSVDADHRRGAGRRWIACRVARHYVLKV